MRFASQPPAGKNRSRRFAAEVASLFPLNVPQMLEWAQEDLTTWCHPVIGGKSREMRGF